MEAGSGRGDGRGPRAGHTFGTTLEMSSAGGGVGRRTSSARAERGNRSTRPASCARMALWSVYVVRTRDGALYTGISTDVARRVGEHAEGRGAKALRGRGPLELVFRRRIGAVGLALRVERRLKRLSRLEKEDVVRRAPTRARLLARLALEDRAGAPTAVPLRRRRRSE